MADCTRLEIGGGILKVDGDEKGPIDVISFMAEKENADFIEAFEVAGGVRAPAIERKKKEDEFEWRSRLRQAERDAIAKASEDYSGFGKRLNTLLMMSGFRLQDDPKRGPVCLLLDNNAQAIPWELLQAGNEHIAAPRSCLLEHARIQVGCSSGELT